MIGTLVRCLAVWLLSGGMAVAEIAYVTDRLLLGLYAEPDSSSRQFRTLPSGTRLDVQERQGLYARIVTDDGLEGWVKVNFLVSDPPAVVRIRTLEEQVESGQPSEEQLAELDTLRGQNLSLNEQLLGLQRELEITQQALANASAAAETSSVAEGTDPGSESTGTDAGPTDAGESPGAATDGQLQAGPGSASGGAGFQFSDLARGDWWRERWWLIVVLSLGSVLGFPAGASWMSYRIRRRFSGVRVW